MISSQLGRMILEGGGTSVDEMRTTHQESGHEDPIEELLDEVASEIALGRRPGGRSSRVGQRPVNRPSR